MGQRSYRQYCSVARALDLVGERWTLLVVRELLTGPKRYKDLLDNLPGIGTNLLADRLRGLRRIGVVERERLPPPAGSQVYRLTQRGRALEPALIALGRWGLRFLGEPSGEDAFRPEWALLAMKITFRSEQAVKVDQTYQLNIGETVFHVQVNHGRVRTRQGPAFRPDLVFHCDPETFFRLASRRVTLEEALEAGNASFEGREEALQQLHELFNPNYS